MKRLLCGFISILLLLSVLSGCGRSKQDLPSESNIPEINDTAEAIDPSGEVALFTEASADSTQEIADATPALSESTVEPTVDVTAIPSEAIPVVPTAAPGLPELDVPVFSEEELMTFLIFAEDECYNDYSSILWHQMKTFLEHAPTDAIRIKDDLHQYGIYETEEGYRLYIIFGEIWEDSGYIAARGYPVFISSSHTYSDFSELKVGDPIDRVAEIDRIAYLIKKQSEKSEKPPERIQWYAEHGWPYASLHYLTDGLLKIEYNMTDEGELYIINMVYSEDYTLIHKNDTIVDYSLFPEDLPKF